MKFFPILIVFSTLGILVGCEEMAVKSPEPTTPPEYLRCRDISPALSQADSIVRSPGMISASEKAYWYDRQQRLVKRAWECK